ncbi:MAG: hypothetical protein AUJ98_02965 [Bacteroidetes bacterium CG2_30_33_31]|nr:MAG: hypothetical protein AUJ98_02965 [Bacteroidetes bacterium CG2_30_33_31]
MKDNLSIIQSKQVLDMVLVANDFCLFTESLDSKVNIDILSYYQKVLPLLYLKGALLPAIEVSDESVNQRFVTAESWQEIFFAIESKFGEEDKYWFVDLNNDMIKESLADNLADIYQDMKDFILLFQDPKLSAKENAVSECKRLFETHWGERITKALNKIHLTIFNTKVEEDI